MGKKSHNKNIVRCSYTGKVVNGKDVILCSEALSYIKALGFTVFDFGISKPALTHEQLMKKIKLEASYGF